MVLLRTYKHIGYGKYVLVTWMQRRCIICQKFLSKRQLKYCSICELVKIKKCNNERTKNKYHNDSKTREHIKLYHLIYYNPNRFNIGEYV